MYLLKTVDYNKNLNVNTIDKNLIKKFKIFMKK
jgi:hypothetical protein